jgi:hypothetical protein
MVSMIPRKGSEYSLPNTRLDFGAAPQRIYEYARTRPPRSTSSSIRHRIKVLPTCEAESAAAACTQGCEAKRDQPNKARNAKRNLSRLGDLKCVAELTPANRTPARRPGSPPGTS